VTSRSVACLIALALAVSPAGAAAENPRPGVPPTKPWACPAEQPIKGNFTSPSGERCVYHVPTGESYGKTKPERCYATEDDAQKDGCRKAKR
jgi:hypothetical protein